MNHAVACFLTYSAKLLLLLALAGAVLYPNMPTVRGGSQLGIQQSPNVTIGKTVSQLVNVATRIGSLRSDAELRLAIVLGFRRG